MKPTKLSDWPLEIQERIKGKQPDSEKLPKPAMTKTEAEYLRKFLCGRDARFEALTFRMANGHKYTPDFVVFECGKPVECHEVKGNYRLHTYQRSRIAYDQCTQEFPGLKWVWAEKRKDGWGNILK